MNNVYGQVIEIKGNPVKSNNNSNNFEKLENGSFILLNEIIKNSNQGYVIIKNIYEENIILKGEFVINEDLLHNPLDNHTINNEKGSIQDLSSISLDEKPANDDDKIDTESDLLDNMNDTIDVKKLEEKKYFMNNSIYEEIVSNNSQKEDTNYIKVNPYVIKQIEVSKLEEVEAPTKEIFHEAIYKTITQENTETKTVAAEPIMKEETYTTTENINREVEIPFEDINLINEVFTNYKTEIVTENIEVEKTRKIIDEEANSKNNIYLNDNNEWVTDIEETFINTREIVVTDSFITEVIDDDKVSELGLIEKDGKFYQKNDIEESFLDTRIVTQDSEPIMKEETYIITENINKDVEVPFEDTRMVEEKFTNYKTVTVIESKEVEKTREVIDEEANTANNIYLNDNNEWIQDVETKFTNTREIITEEAYDIEVIDTQEIENLGLVEKDGKFYQVENVSESFTDMKTESVSSSPIMKEEIYYETQEEESQINIPFEDTRMIEEKFTNYKTVTVTEDIEVEKIREVPSKNLNNGKDFYLNDNNEWVTLEPEKFINTKEVLDIPAYEEKVLDSYRIAELGLVEKDGHYFRIETSTEEFIDTRINEEEVDLIYKTENYEDIENISENIAINKTREVIDEDAMLKAGYTLANDNIWIEKTSEEFTNTRIVVNEHKVDTPYKIIEHPDVFKNVSFEDTRMVEVVSEPIMKEEIYLTTQEIQKDVKVPFEDTRMVEEQFTNYKIDNITAFNKIKKTREVIDEDANATHNIYLNDNNEWVQDVEKEFQNTKVVENYTQVETPMIIKQIEATKSIEEFEDIKIENIFSKPITKIENYTEITQTEVAKQIPFEDIRIVEEHFTNYKTETVSENIEVEKTREVIDEDANAAHNIYLNDNDEWVAEVQDNIIQDKKILVSDAFNETVIDIDKMSEDNIVSKDGHYFKNIISNMDVTELDKNLYDFEKDGNFYKYINDTNIKMEDILIEQNSQTNIDFSNLSQDDIKELTSEDIFNSNNQKNISHYNDYDSNKLAINTDISIYES